MRWGSGVGWCAWRWRCSRRPGAGAAEPARGGGVEFELKATNGYSIMVIAGWNPQVPDGAVALFVSNGRGAVTYEAPAGVDATVTTIEADLGSLGHISLQAQPTGVKRMARSSCDKRPVH